MERLDHKLSALLRKKNRTLEEDLGDFFKDLLADLKKLSQYRVKRLSSSEHYIKDKLINNSAGNAESFLKDFNDYMIYHAAAFKELLEKYKSPKDIESDKEWVLAVSSFRDEVRLHLTDLSNTAKGLLGNLQFLEEKYELSSEQDTRIQKLKKRIEEVSKIDYDKFTNIFLKGKILQV